MQNNIIQIGVSYEREQQINTEKYKIILLSQGMEQIAESELIEKLNTLGYKIDKPMCHNYYNNLNENHYLAKSMNYIDIKSKQSAFHFEQSFANSNNLEKLQKIRLNYFVFDGKRIWDL